MSNHSKVKVVLYL